MFPPMEKFGRQWKRGLGHSTESLPITAVRNTAERSFGKLRLIKTFHRSTMTDERLTNLAMMSLESETVKTVDMLSSFWLLNMKRLVILK